MATDPRNPAATRRRYGNRRPDRPCPEEKDINRIAGIIHRSSRADIKALRSTAVSELLRNAYRRSPIVGLSPNCSSRKIQDRPILSIPAQVFTTRKMRTESRSETRNEVDPKFEIRSDSTKVVSVYNNMEITGIVRLPRRDSLASAFKNLLFLNVFIITS